MITFRYWLRNLFTDADGEFSERRWAVLSVVFAVALTCGLVCLCRDMPATGQQTTTITVNDPGNAPVTVIVNQP